MRFHLVIGGLILLRLMLFAWFVMKQGEYLEEDSGYYLWLADILREHHVFSQEAQPPFSPQVFRTPGYPAFLALLGMLGMQSPYWAVFWQEIIYGIYAFIFFHYGKPLFGEKIARIGLLFLLLEPGGLATPKMILSETLFLPLLLGGVLAVGYYLLSLNWRYLALAGGLMGLGAFIRPGILYFPVVVALTLLFFNFANWKRWWHVSVLLLVFSLIISPWLLRNYFYYGKIFMSGQQSNMLANYHVPVVWESAKGVPFWTGHALIKEQVNLAIRKKSNELQRPLSTVERFEVEQQLALQELSKYPGDYFKQWLYGILKTMNGANLLGLYHAFDYRVDRLRFFAIEETNFTKKVIIFLNNQDYVYLFEVLLRVLIAGFALLGTISIIKKKDCFLWIILLANFYFICSPGPMGYARFRFPVEVLWFIQAMIGYYWFLGVYRQWQPGRPQC